MRTKVLINIILDKLTYISISKTKIKTRNRICNYNKQKKHEILKNIPKRSQERRRKGMEEARQLENAKVDGRVEHNQ